MKLHGRIPDITLPQPVIGRIVADGSTAIQGNEILLLDDHSRIEGHEQVYPLTLARPGSIASQHHPTLPEALNYLEPGDIIRVGTNGDIATMYRMRSPHNSMLVTEQCNSRCVMCSQPPRAIDDSYLLDEWMTAVPLMSPATRELGITGGEPTLNFQRLLELIHTVKAHLPETALHILTNGRLFAYLVNAQRLAACQHRDLMLGIPLYADIDDLHDFVVQAKGAFEQTVSGLINLARVRQNIEIRFVIHRLTYERLGQFAQFVTRNLPFVRHVALMGLELMGYARTNLDALWIDPVEYQEQLKSAVNELRWARLNVSIYNLPLCLLDREVWPYARQSISDWKNIYMSECDSCAVREHCAGFFASSALRRSTHIRALREDDRAELLRIMSSYPAN